MTGSDVLFDTWAWWEYLHGTRTGESLRRRFVGPTGIHLHTSAISLAELAAKLAAEGSRNRIDLVCGSIRRASRVWDVTADLAVEGGIARAELRRSTPSASLADGIVFATARHSGARIVSADPAFRYVPGVITR